MGPEKQLIKVADYKNKQGQIAIKNKVQTNNEVQKVGKKKEFKDVVDFGEPPTVKDSELDHLVEFKDNPRKVLVNKICAATFSEIGNNDEQQKYVMGEPEKASMCWSSVVTRSLAVKQDKNSSSLDQSQ